MRPHETASIRTEAEGPRRPELYLVEAPSAPPRARPSIGAWLMALRPKTLVAGAVPVLVGTSLAVREGRPQLLPALAALAWSVLIQISSNLANDYYDFKNGADTAERLGPKRVTQSGLISPERVFAGMLVSFAVAAAAGLWLAAFVGWPMLAVIAVSIAAAHGYTGGPYPYGYRGLGDAAVMIFFGLVPVSLAYVAQTGHLPAVVLLCSLPIGGMGVMILVVNNLRDASTDVKAGKRTLVVRFGTGWGKAEYLAMLALGYGTPVGLWLAGRSGPWLLLAWLSLPLAWPPLRRVLRETGAPLNHALGETARLELAYSVLLCVGLWLNPVR